MLQCLRERATSVGCALAVITAIAEMACMAYYLRSYGDYLRKNPPPPGSGLPPSPILLSSSSSSNPSSSSNHSGTQILDTIHGLADSFLTLVADTNTFIGVAVTFITSLLCNVLLLYGVCRRRVLCFIPWLLLHAALWMEAVMAMIFCAIQSITRGSLYVPLLSTLGASIALLVVWWMVKDVFLVLYLGDGSYPGSQEERYYYTNGGSDYSRDHIMEMHSFAHSSPRVSIVANMDKDRVHL